MAKDEQDAVGRRKFLSGAAATAAAMVGNTDDASAGQDSEEQEHGHEHQTVPADIALRVKALESVLVEKKMVEPSELDAIVDLYENKVGPRNGARVVARAWTDPEFKRRLLESADEAIAEFGFEGPHQEHLLVVENEPNVHNLVVCTLCSCYPWSTLGLPPVWYKSAPYRSRAVIDPRGVLEEFGVELDADVEVRVWDSTAEQRYMVLPERPPGTDGMSEAELEELVSRDSMIGVAKLEASTARGDA